MTISSSNTQTREIAELRNHLKWLDEERRKSTRKMTELEQKLAQQGREIGERDKKIQDLEWYVADLSQQLEKIIDPTAEKVELDRRLLEFEGRVNTVQAEFDQLSTQYEERVVALQTDFEELSGQYNERMVALAAESQTNISSYATRLQEHLENQLTAYKNEIVESVGKIGNARELMALLNRIQQDLELREAEGARLAELINSQETRYNPLMVTNEAVQERTAILSERLTEVENMMVDIQQHVHDYANSGKPLLLETNRLLKPLNEKLVELNNKILKVDAGIKSIVSEQSEIRSELSHQVDSLQQAESTMGKQMETWQATLDENKETVERFSQQWVALSTQYKEARMAVQNMAHWQKQLEQQKREAAEMLRVESNRIQARWDGLMDEIQEKLKNFEHDLGRKIQTIEIDNEQKWSAARRTEQLWREEIAVVDDLIQKLQQDNRNMIMRMQAAQVNVIKKLPGLLMEEVEGVADSNPTRRFALNTTSTAARGDLSVADAIEQGLIKVDYTDDIKNE